MPKNKRELIIAVLDAHTMTQSTIHNHKTGINTHGRHCADCGAGLPWTDWEPALIEHQADVLVEILGL